MGHPPSPPLSVLSSPLTERQNSPASESEDICATCKGAGEFVCCEGCPRKDAHVSSVFFAGIHRVGKDEVFIATTLRRPEDDAGQRARTSALPAKVQASLSAVKDAHVSSIFFAAIHRVCKYQKGRSIATNAVPPRVDPKMTLLNISEASSRCSKPSTRQIRTRLPCRRMSRVTSKTLLQEATGLIMRTSGSFHCKFDAFCRVIQR